MKKSFLLIAVPVLIASAASAQVKIGIAPEIGINIANMHGNEPDSTSGSTVYSSKKRETDIKLGFKAGANLNIPIGDRLVIQPGLFYSIKGWKSSETEGPTTVGGITTSESESNNVTLHYFEVPVNLQYNFNDVGEGRLFIGVGGYVGVGFSGHNKYSASASQSGGGTSFNFAVDTTIKLTFGDDKAKSYTLVGQTEYRRIDGGVSVNVGYMLQSGIFFRGMYQLGLANLVPGEDNNNTLKNSVFTVSLGYQLGGRPEANKKKAKGGDM